MFKNDDVTVERLLCLQLRHRIRGRHIVSQSWMNIRNYTIFHKVAIVIVFLTVLLSLRWLWFTTHETPDHPNATQGVLDLRSWDFKNSRTIPLNGEWEFYPEAFFTHEDFVRSKARQPHYVQVPGDWRNAFPQSEQASSSFGYGTYRLRILVDQPLNESYAFWIREIQASSQLEINGQTEGAFGLPSDRAETYWPKAVSYTGTYTAHNAKEIELLVRACCYCVAALPSLRIMTICSFSGCP